VNIAILILAVIVGIFVFGKVAEATYENARREMESVASVGLKPKKGWMYRKAGKDQLCVHVQNYIAILLSDTGEMQLFIVGDWRKFELEPATTETRKRYWASYLTD